MSTQPEAVYHRTQACHLPTSTTTAPTIPLGFIPCRPMIIMVVRVSLLNTFESSHIFPVPPAQYPSQHDQELLLAGDNTIYNAAASGSSRPLIPHATPSPTVSAHSPQGGPDSEPAPSKRSSSPPRYTNKRREKPRIELAPDQPLTTQGKPRTRVYVACVQWYVSACFSVTQSPY